MSQDDAKSSQLQQILESLQQGDVFLDVVIPVAYFSNSNFPLTAAAKDFASEFPSQTAEANLITEEAAGLIVITQTCDILKAPEKSPLIQFVRVVKEQPNIVQIVKRGNHGRYVFLPELEPQCPLADLDVGVYFEKPMLLLMDHQSKIRAVKTDEHISKFSNAVSRKFNRFAFPDDFNASLVSFRDIIDKNINKMSDLGALLRSVLEIRVSTEMNEQWESAAPIPTLNFFFEDEDKITQSTRDVLNRLMDKHFVSTGKFSKAPKMRFETYDNVTADFYRRSNPLDLSHLTKSK